MAHVQKMTPLSTYAGGSVLVFGAGFDSSCDVLIDGEPTNILDYDDSSIEFAAPANIGNYSVTIVRNNEPMGQFGLSVVALRDSMTWNIDRRGNDEFRNALLGLLPRGFAFFAGRGGNWWKLFSAIGAGFLAVYNLLRELVDEMSPVKTTSYADWERELGLLARGNDRTDDARLSEIFRIARKLGGCTIPYFKSVIALFGLDAEIYEYWKNPEKFSDVEFGDDNPNFYWMVELAAAEDDWHYCTCNDTCNDYLQWWWNVPVESMIQLIKPAHTKLVFGYTVSD